MCPSEPRENDAFKTLARALHVHCASQPHCFIRRRNDNGAGRPATGTMVVPAFQRVDRYHPGANRTSRSGVIHKSAWTHKFHISNAAAKLLPTHPLRIDSNDKSLCQGIGAFITRGRQCLIALPSAKIVDIAMRAFNSSLSFTWKAPLKDAPAHVHHAPHHPVSFTVE